MSTHRKARADAGESPVDRRFRRPVVVELTSEELPLLDTAEARHGTKRSALVAALSAEARINELERALADAERAATRRAADGDKRATAKARAKLERELSAARKQIAKQQAELEAARARAADADSATDGQLRVLEAELDARETEIADLEPYVVDHLYCARCDTWVPPSGWVWQASDDGGEYAFHEDCGDHARSVVSPSSWLAHRNA